MPVLHKKGLVQPVRVFQLDIEHRIKMTPHHRTDWSSRRKISNCEGDEIYADDNEDEADEPFEQELNHITPLAPLKEVINVFITACPAISIQCPIVHRPSLLKKSVHETAPFHRQKPLAENNRRYISELLLILSDISAIVKRKAWNPLIHWGCRGRSACQRALCPRTFLSSKAPRRPA